MKKIRKEVELMGSIQDCGNVVGLHGVYEDDAQVYVVMELCSGGDLERILEVRGHYLCGVWIHAVVSIKDVVC